MSNVDRRFINAVTYDPSWRSKEARHSNEPSSDPYVLRYRQFLADVQAGTANEDYAVQVAHDIFRTDWFRCEVEAYMMDNVDFVEIAKRYDVSPEAIDAYCHLFFDITPLKGDGSRKRIANDPTVSSSVRKARQFGYRYGKLFLDWYSCKISSITPEESAKLDEALEALLRMKIFNMDSLQLSDTDQIKTGVVLIKAFSEYKSAMNQGADAESVNGVLNTLNNLVRIATPPQGLPPDLFKERQALPKVDTND